MSDKLIILRAAKAIVLLVMELLIFVLIGILSVPLLGFAASSEMRITNDDINEYQLRALESAKNIGLSEEACFSPHSVFAYDLCYIAKARVFLDSLDPLNPLKQLFDVEVAQLKSYTDHQYHFIDEALETKNPELLKERGLAIKIMKSALTVLPVFDDGVVYRDLMYYSDEEWPSQIDIDRLAAKFKVGSKISAKTFWIASLGTSPEAKQYVVDSALVLLKIQSKSARYLGDLSSRPDQQEVLFAPGAKFEVVSATAEPVGMFDSVRMKYIFTLKEI
jgi:hypothetical protein